MKTLYPFQIQGRDFLVSHRNAILADDMGCISGDAIVSINRGGKTKKFTLADACEGWHERWDKTIPTHIRGLKANGQFGLVKVKDIRCTGIKSVRRLTTFSGKEITLTHDHELLLPNDNWVPAERLVIGDYIAVNGILKCKECGSEVITVVRYDSIVKIELLNPKWVYDVMCEEPHNFVANGIVVHNCGKTVTTIEAVKSSGITKGLILCPLSVRRSWVKVLRDQFPSAFIKEITSPKCPAEPTAFNVINYDIVWREPLIKDLQKYQWPVLIMDEQHKLKNIESKRTKAVLGRFGLYNRCERRWGLTGTPVLNRPVELFPILRSLCPDMLGIYTDFYRYAYRFCGGFQDVFGFNVSGASHLDELSKLLQPVMLRRLKEEVLSDLPEVTYDKVYLEPTNKLLSLSRQEKAEQGQKELDKQIGETSSLRRMLGVLKAEAAIEHLEDLLETKTKAVVFTWHHEVVDVLMAHFKNRAVAYTGRQSVAEKEKAKDDFIKRPEVKLFVGNIDAAGQGVDGLQEVCDVCVFVELSHVPGIIKQAVDRLRRIGQARPVLAQFLVVEDSMDEDFVDNLTSKSKNINTILQERREVNFVGVKCSVCGSPKEMKEIRRAAGLPVCAKCEKLMNSIL